LPQLDLTVRGQPLIELLRPAYLALGELDVTVRLPA